MDQPVEPSIAAPAPAEGLPLPPPPLTPVAPYWHTTGLIALMLIVGIVSALTLEKQGRTSLGPIAIYLPTIAWLWALFALAVFGIRRRGVTIKELMGKAWHRFDDVLMDLILAGAFWLVAMVVLVSVSLLLTRLQHAPLPQKVPAELELLSPRGPLGISLWVVLSISAGICEEFVFRGYLQRQFAALTQRPAFGILLSAAVFVGGHLYEGTTRALVIGVYGAMFGVLAWWRRSLRPGMIAHAWHDIFTGLLLSVLTAHGNLPR